MTVLYQGFIQASGVEIYLRLFASYGDVPQRKAGGGGGIRGSARASRPRSSANKVQANSLLKLYFSCYIIQSFTEVFKAGKIGMGFFGG